MGAMQTIPFLTGPCYSVEPVSLTMVKWARTRRPTDLKLTQIANTEGPFKMSQEYKQWLKDDLGERETSRRERIYDLIKDSRLGLCREDILEAVEATHDHDLRKKRRLERERKKMDKTTLKKLKRT